jgi:hypothetical protein
MEFLELDDCFYIIMRLNRKFLFAIQYKCETLLFSMIKTQWKLNTVQIYNIKQNLLKAGSSSYFFSLAQRQTIRNRKLDYELLGSYAKYYSLPRVLHLIRTHADKQDFPMNFIRWRFRSGWEVFNFWENDNHAEAIDYLSDLVAEEDLQDLDPYVCWFGNSENQCNWKIYGLFIGYVNAKAKRTKSLKTLIKASKQAQMPLPSSRQSLDSAMVFEWCMDDQKPKYAASNIVTWLLEASIPDSFVGKSNCDQLVQSHMSELAMEERKAFESFATENKPILSLSNENVDEAECDDTVQNIRDCLQTRMWLQQITCIKTHPKVLSSNQFQGISIIEDE